MKIYLLVLLTIILSGCGIDKESPPPLSSTNNSGELDTSFNGTGFLSIDGSAGGSGQDDIYAITKDSQNRIISVGSSFNGGDLDMAVWRLNANGSLDTSFASNGVFIHDSAAGGTSTDVAYGVVVDSSDNIYVTGTSFNGADFDMSVWKLNSNGTLDTSFNGSGVFVDDGAAGGGIHDQGSAIHLDASGNIFVTGFSDRDATNRDMAVWKLLPNGTPDNSFDSDGIFVCDGAAGGDCVGGSVSGEDDFGNDILTDSSGNVYVVGRADSVGNLGDMTVWRLTSAGVLDTSFSGDGIFTHDDAAGGTGLDSATAFVINSQGRLVITGFSRNSDGNNDMVIWKVLTTGNLDTTFNAVGFVTFDVSDIVGGGTNDTGEDIIIDSQGRIVVTGSGNEDMCIWRYNQDGSLDQDFNTDGFFSHDSAAGGFDIDSGTSVVEGASNQLYIGGFSENNSGDFDATFWRLK